MFHLFLCLAIKKAVEEWKAKKANGKTQAGSDDDDEENIYAVENDVNIILIGFYYLFRSVIIQYYFSLMKNNLKR